ncbi:nitrite reductase small subunit NirD [Haloechinothrix sp. YIM 98757]|uniref:Nitrite reductase small subunit NirD n=1 Tax=Haloechinothrix aidingensis TaxID=2752311 RepID=A0A838AFP1_9PSEU|nr:nitrite reductase small subunit NirD [Haloechinothrix aidingensis]MBA0127957.1 nitrite reductase small subunit NirD [Haloechinothrix aidingensis]
MNAGTVQANDRSSWTRVCSVDAVPQAGGVAALLPGGVQAAVFRVPSGAVYALSNIDPFSGAAVLARGIVGDTNGVPFVASPLHKERFDLRTGECLDDASVRVSSFDVLLDDGVVFVREPWP